MLEAVPIHIGIKVLTFVIVECLSARDAWTLHQCFKRRRLGDNAYPVCLKGLVTPCLLGVA